MSSSTSSTDERVTRYRRRAKDLRDVAQGVPQDSIRRALTDIADSYDRMAERLVNKKK